MYPIIKSDPNEVRITMKSWRALPPKARLLEKGRYFVLQILNYGSKQPHKVWRQVTIC